MVFPLLPFVAMSQKTAAPALPIVTGADVAVVQTESGKVRGYIHNGTYTYKGIPYAQAKRFTAPVKPTPWEGIRSSTSYGPVCPVMSRLSSHHRVAKP